MRRSEGGRLVLSTYGLTTGLYVDPIEKKPLNHFYPGSTVLSFGTTGCNMGCLFCQNWHISKARALPTIEVSPEAIARAAAENGCKSVAFTYNEPLIFAEYAIDTALCCRKLGIETVAVTAGYVHKEARQDFFAQMSAANVDLKAFSEDFYRRMCAADLKTVLDTLTYIKERTKVWLEITTLLIPGQNDDEKEIAAMSAWIVKQLGADTPLHFSAYHPAHKAQFPPTPPQTLTRAREIARGQGVQYVYTGNVHDLQGQSTYCHSCGQMLVERNGFDIGQNNLTKGNCRFCDVKCPGRF